MTAVARARDAEWVLLLCEDCGRPFHLTARQGRAIRAEKRSARCRSCRRVVKQVVVSSEHYEFWLSRFTMSELVEIAEWAWGDVDTWKPGWRDGIVFDDPPSLPPL